MAEEPSLPQLPAPVFPWDQRQSLVTNGKKRVRLHGTTEPPPPLTSSDPALFSSDDDPSLENYNGGRKKRRLKGSWYEQQPASSDPMVGEDVLATHPRPNRKFARHFDSGIWMAEGNEVQEDGDDVPAHSSTFPPPSKRAQFRRQLSQFSTAEKIARERIRACVELGEDAIDLSDLGLSTISNDTIEPLTILAHIPVVAEGVPFETAEPELKIFLAKNPLQTLPGALFDLANVSTLSLRHTGLRELPDGIGRLGKLKDLNLMSNRLRYLPGSLLGLLGEPGPLRHLRCLGNSTLFFLEDLQCKGSSAGADEEASSAIRQDDLAAWAGLPVAAGAVFVARTPVETCDTMGRPESDFILNDFLLNKRASLAEDANLALLPRASQLSSRRPWSHPVQTKVPSLLELALRKCYDSSSLAELPQFLPDDGFSSLQSLLRQALAQKEEGGKQCSQCGKLFVFPRTKWIEWWRLTGDTHISPAEEEKGCYHDILPFIHFGCSTSCLPRHIKRGTTLEELRTGRVDKDSPISAVALHR